MKEIQSLKGMLNGVPILFYRDSAITWKADIPKVSTGIYMVEIFAVDYAGNESFFASAILKVDLKGISFEILPENYSSKMMPEGYSFQSIHENHSVGPLDERFTTKTLGENFSYKELIL